MDLTLRPDMVVVPARTGRAFRVRRGDRVTFTDVAGGQVGDLFAFAQPADGERVLGEHLSASHTRSVTGRLFPAVGEAFVTDRRRPILRLVEDTSPGRHDLLIAACDDDRYRLLGAPGHPSCAANLRTALDAIGFETPHVPQPVNLFMNVPVRADGRLELLAALTSPGDGITFAVELDAVLVLSACPQDLNPINGDGPTDLAVTVTPHLTQETSR